MSGSSLNTGSEFSTGSRDIWKAHNKYTQTTFLGTSWQAIFQGLKFSLSSLSFSAFFLFLLIHSQLEAAHTLHSLVLSAFLLCAFLFLNSHPHTHLCGFPFHSLTHTSHIFHTHTHHMHSPFTHTHTLHTHLTFSLHSLFTCSSHALSLSVSFCLCLCLCLCLSLSLSLIIHSLSTIPSYTPH